MSGHAYSRTLRVHSLSRAALGRLILESCQEDGRLSASNMETLQKCYEKIFEDGPSEEYFHQVEESLQAVSSWMTAKGEKSCTSKQWLNYFRHTAIIHDFVRAERAGD